MEDDLRIIEGFLSEYNQTAGTNLAIKAEDGLPAEQQQEQPQEQPAEGKQPKGKGKGKPALKVIQGGIKAMPDSIKVPSLDDMPVPSGGIALMLFLVLVCWLALIKAPGQNVTRLNLAWQALLGKARFGQAGSSGGNGVTSTSGQGQTVTQAVSQPPSIPQGSDTITLSEAGQYGWGLQGVTGQ